MPKWVTLREAADVLGVIYNRAYHLVVRHGQADWHIAPGTVRGQPDRIRVSAASLGRLAKARRGGRREPPKGWVDKYAAADVMGVTTDHACKQARDGKVRAVRVSRPLRNPEWWFCPKSLAKRAAARARGAEVPHPENPLAYRRQEPLGPSGLTVEAFWLPIIESRRARLAGLGVKVAGL